MYETQHNAYLIDLVVLLLDLFFLVAQKNFLVRIAFLFSTLTPKAFAINLA